LNTQKIIIIIIVNGGSGICLLPLQEKMTSDLPTTQPN
jgi:hypothetical protein